MSINGKTIGVGITTRNRSYVLDVGLLHLAKYSKHIDTVVIVDDSSDDNHREVAATAALNSGLPVNYRYSTKRLGVSNAKNACLYPLQEFDHVFMFDDDCWPSSEGWEEYWISCNDANGIQHSMWLVDFPGLNHVITKVGTLGEGASEMSSFSNCLGVALYFSKDCIKALGGYRGDVPNVYGYEHAHMSMRAHNAGFTAGHKYLTPSNLHEYIYSIDISLNWMGQQPPLTNLTDKPIDSSVTHHELSGAASNSFLMTDYLIHIPLVDPLGT